MTTSSDRTAITALLNDQAAAIRAKDTASAIAPYSADFVRFDLAPPLATSGPDLDPQDLEAWFATWRGPIGYQFRDLDVSAAGDLAFAHGYLHISGTKVDGEQPALWARITFCLRRRDGAWKIVHEHSSVPFYMDGSYRAATDLHP
ncbi:PhnB protein [Rhodoligotrophos appendicifer]|uniref:YybH family protein n=1 Tax=Rhodoligotrophos appendicifer TaxID=987056 RepID=UPI00117F270D|nr:nuclear transport factor 2 family protein [Rhodoligotrophos appendicifer]